MFVDVFNSPYDRILMMSGRQVSKTVTMAAKMVAEAVTTPHLPIIYANASGTQTSSFSTSKLDPFLIHSPAVYHNMLRKKHVINNVFHKRFDNWSEIRLSYFSESADRIRGNTGFRFYLDEVQDILYDAVIDAEECLSAAKTPRFTYAGTSKSMTSTLAFYWSLSTQKEWIIKCRGCGKWNRPSEENIHLQGLACKKCGTLLNTYAGKWHSFRDPKEKPAQYDGYHVPQIILPLHCCDMAKWKTVLNKFENYPMYKFRNEVMGLPHGEGDNPITEEVLQRACIPELKMEDRKTAANSTGATYLTAGIDWGGNGIEGTSRTTLSIYAVYPERNQYIKIYGKIYGAGDPTQHVEDIGIKLNTFGVHMCFGDHGGGNFAMSHLASRVHSTRIVPVMYSDQSAPFKWDERAGRYTVNRTTMIDAFFLAVQNGEVKTFRWEEFAQFAPDILAVKEETIGEEAGKPRRVWRRYPTKPDDILHSMVFGWFACRIMCSQLNF
jgi:hypothetical protein